MVLLHRIQHHEFMATVLDRNADIGADLAGHITAEARADRIEATENRLAAKEFSGDREAHAKEMVRLERQKASDMLKGLSGDLEQKKILPGMTRPPEPPRNIKPTERQDFDERMVRASGHDNAEEVIAANRKAQQAQQTAEEQTKAREGLDPSQPDETAKSHTPEGRVVDKKEAAKAAAEKWRNPEAFVKKADKEGPEKGDGAEPPRQMGGGMER
jgi:hypothetical protein